MIAAACCRDRVFGQVGTLRCNTRCSFGHASELHRALRDEIDVILNIFVHLVEEFVKSDEVRTFHIPMGKLALRLQVDCVSEPFIAKPNDLAAGRLRKIVLRRIHMDCSVVFVITTGESLIMKLPAPRFAPCWRGQPGGSFPYRVHIGS